jgi:hypothetical protein
MKTCRAVAAIFLLLAVPTFVTAGNGFEDSDLTDEIESVSPFSFSLGLGLRTDESSFLEHPWSFRGILHYEWKPAVQPHIGLTVEPARIQGSDRDAVRIALETGIRILEPRRVFGLFFEGGVGLYHHRYRASWATLTDTRPGVFFGAGGTLKVSRTVRVTAGIHHVFNYVSDYVYYTGVPEWEEYRPLGPDSRTVIPDALFNPTTLRIDVRITR